MYVSHSDQLPQETKREILSQNVKGATSCHWEKNPVKSRYHSDVSAYSTEAIFPLYKRLFAVLWLHITTLLCRFNRQLTMASTDLIGSTWVEQSP